MFPGRYACLMMWSAGAFTRHGGDRPGGGGEGSEGWSDRILKQRSVKSGEDADERWKHCSPPPHGTWSMADSQPHAASINTMEAWSSDQTPSDTWSLAISCRQRARTSLYTLVWIFISYFFFCLYFFLSLILFCLFFLSSVFSSFTFLHKCTFSPFFLSLFYLLFNLSSFLLVLYIHSFLFLSFLFPFFIISYINCTFFLVSKSLTHMPLSLENYFASEDLASRHLFDHRRCERK